MFTRWRVGTALEMGLGGAGTEAVNLSSGEPGRCYLGVLQRQEGVVCVHVITGECLWNTHAMVNSGHSSCGSFNEPARPAPSTPAATRGLAGLHGPPRSAAEAEGLCPARWQAGRGPRGIVAVGVHWGGHAGAGLARKGCSETLQRKGDRQEGWQERAALRTRRQHGQLVPCAGVWLREGTGATSPWGALEGGCTGPGQGQPAGSQASPGRAGAALRPTLGLVPCPIPHGDMSSSRVGRQGPPSHIRLLEDRGRAHARIQVRELLAETRAVQGSGVGCVVLPGASSGCHSEAVESSLRCTQLNLAMSRCGLDCRGGGQARGGAGTDGGPVCRGMVGAGRCQLRHVCAVSGPEMPPQRVRTVVLS